MPLDPVLLRALLGAIEADSLIFLCGAGLSTAPPSNLPSAVRVAQICYDRWHPVDPLDPALREDLARLADHFYDQGNFRTGFLRIVPWNELLGMPNPGHAAISDLLITRAARAALSANFDPLIENWARERKFDMRGALDGREATDFAVHSSPLVKFHGCMERDRENTVWTQKQFPEHVIRERTETCTQWINLNLPGKHVVVIGFWSEWGYLNDALAAALGAATASAVTVVDLDTSANLERKAPALWRNLHNLSTHFEHVPMSGADFLDELRTAFSKTWARRFYATGEPLARAAGVAVPAAPDSDGMNSGELYDFRRDAEGVSYAYSCTSKIPPHNVGQAALARLTLLASGAVTEGAWLKHKGKSIRIVNGAGEGIESMRARYKEPTVLDPPDIVLCAGALRLGLPATIIPSGTSSSIVRAAGGSGAAWLSLDETKAEIGI